MFSMGRSFLGFPDKGGRFSRANHRPEAHTGWQGERFPFPKKGGSLQPGTLAVRAFEITAVSRKVYPDMHFVSLFLQPIEESPNAVPFAVALGVIFPRSKRKSFSPTDNSFHGLARLIPLLRQAFSSSFGSVRTPCRKKP